MFNVRDSLEYLLRTNFDILRKISSWDVQDLEEYLLNTWGNFFVVYFSFKQDR